MSEQGQPEQSSASQLRSKEPTPQEKRDALLHGAGKLQVGRREQPQSPADEGRVRRIAVGLALSVVVVGIIVALSMGLAADISL